MKPKVKVIFFFILLLYIFFAIMSIYPYYQGDEVLDIMCAKGIIERGAPITDYGANYPDFKCYGHIPSFRYILAGFIFLFGENIYLLRGFMMSFNILTISLVYLITKEILKENPSKDSWALVAVFLYALNPLTIINSIMVEPDGTLLNLSLYLFLYLFIKKKNYYFLLPALLFVFFSKEVGPCVLFASLFLFYLITRDYKKIISTTILFLIGGIITLGIWWSYSTFVGISVFEALKFNFQTAGGGFELRTLLTNFWTLKLFVYFAIPFFILLFLIFTILFYKKLIKDKNFLKKEDNKKILLINLFALVVILLYFYLGDSSYGFIKYQVIAMPAIAIFITFILSKSNIFGYLKKRTILTKYFIILILILSLYFTFIVGDPFIPEFDEARLNVNIPEIIKPVLITFSLYFLIPFIFSIGFLYIKIKNFWAILLISLLLLTFFTYFYINIHHTTVDYSTHFRYGDAGKKEVLEYIQNQNISAKEILTSLNLGYHINSSGYYEIVFTNYRDPILFKETLKKNKDINYLIIWHRDIAKMGENMNYFEFEKKIGSYYIYRRISLEDY